MSDENFLGPTTAITIKILAHKQNMFITFPIPAIFCAYNLRAGCAEQPLTLNYHTATYISLLREDMGLQESAFGLSAACTSTILALRNQQLSLLLLYHMHSTLRVSLFRQNNYSIEESCSIGTH